MQVQQISEINLKKTRSNSQKKKDLTSFGNQAQPSPQIDEKKADKAIKNTFLSNISFKGHTQHITHSQIGTAGAISITDPVRSSGPSSRDGVETLIKQTGSFHPNSSIEETKYNNKYTTGRIYYLDPEEIINEQTKRDHDFIVYDNKPKYPTLEEISENYFSITKDSENFGQHFKTIAEYHERLEKADRRAIDSLRPEQRNAQEELNKSREAKNMFEEKIQKYPWEIKELKKDLEKANYFHAQNESRLNDINQKIGYYEMRISDSITQQNKSIEAFKIFDEVGLMFMNKDRLSKEVAEHKKVIAEGAPQLDTFTTYMHRVKDKDLTIPKFEAIKKQLQDNLNVTKNWRDYQDKNLNNVEIYSFEKEKIKNELKGLDNKIKIIESEIAEVDQNISRIKSSFTYRDEYFKKIQKNIPKLEQDLKNQLEELKSFFPKMKNFYNNHFDEMRGMFRHL